jgi:hypothetical protein
MSPLGFSRFALMAGGGARAPSVQETEQRKGLIMTQRVVILLAEAPFECFRPFPLMQFLCAARASFGCLLNRCNLRNLRIYFDEL